MDARRLCRHFEAYDKRLDEVIVERDAALARVRELEAELHRAREDAAAARAEVAERDGRLAKYEALDRAISEWQRAGVAGDMRETLRAWAEVQRLRVEAAGRGEKL